MALNTNHGVLSNGVILSTQNNQWVKTTVNTAAISNLESLMRVALESGLSHMWVHENANLQDSETFCKHDAAYWDFLLNFNPHTEKLLTCTGGVRESKQRWVNVIYPRNSRWATLNRELNQDGWAKVATPVDLLRTVGHVEKALGVKMTGSPSSMGWKLLYGMHPEWFSYRDHLDMSYMHMGAETAKDLVWQRKSFSSSRLNKKYVHKVDKNSAYLASCESEFYGMGIPRRVKGELAFSRRPGVKHDPVGSFLCSIVPATDPILNDLYPSGDYWLMGPTVRLLRARGYEVEIKGGYVFPDEHQSMKQWANKLFNARQSFKDDTTQWPYPVPAQYASQALKQIAVATVGMMGYGGYDENEKTDKRRPDLKSQTVSRTFELMYHNIMKLQEVTGELVDMVYMDALYILSDNPNGHEVFKPLLYRKDKSGKEYSREKDLGGYKYEGRVEITPEIRDVLGSSVGIAKKLECLNTAGWSK